MYTIGILSDTHGLLRPEVKDLLHTCDALLHSGDFNTPQLLEQLKTIAPLYAVRGNTDREWASELPLTLSIELFGLRFFMIHDKQMIRGDIRKNEIRKNDIIIFGHSHKYEETRINGQTWLNPGSCGPKRFSLPVTMALLQTAGDGTFEIRRISLQMQDLPAAPAACKILPADDTAERNTGRTFIESCAYRLPSDRSIKRIIQRVMKETDKGKPVPAIAKSCRIDEALASRICRLYLTHPGVSADGILTKMGL